MILCHKIPHWHLHPVKNGFVVEFVVRNNADNLPGPPVLIGNCFVFKIQEYERLTSASVS